MYVSFDLLVYVPIKRSLYFCKSSLVRHKPFLKPTSRGQHSSNLYSCSLTLCLPVKQTANRIIHTDLQLLLEFAVEASQHGVGFLVFSDCHLDFPPLPGLQPGKVFSGSDFDFFLRAKYRTVLNMDQD